VNQKRAAFAAAESVVQAVCSLSLHLIRNLEVAIVARLCGNFIAILNDDRIFVSGVKSH